MRTVDVIFTSIESIVLREDQSFVGLHEKLLFFTFGENFNTFSLSFLCAVSHAIIGTFIEHSSVILMTWIHPFMVDISAPFLLQDIIPFEVDLYEPFILESPEFD